MKWLTFLLFTFALSFTFFAIQSGDALMYLALARDFLMHGEFPKEDPYLYSLPHAQLHIAHEYLSYFIFYGAWSALGFAGLILLKALVLGVLFALVLRAEPRAKNSSVLFCALWILAVVAGSFRFIERTSLFSDLFCVVMVSWLVEQKTVTRGFIVRLTALFLLWVQLHPGYPLGLIMLTIWAAHMAWSNPELRKKDLLWLLIPVAVLVLNPLFIDGALYPFHFALNEAQVLKLHNFEWFPSYHPAFRFAPEIIAYWGLLLGTFFILFREKAWFTLRGLLALFAALCGIQAVRFVTWASFALLILVKPWAELRLNFRFLRPVLAGLMVLILVKNLTIGYTASSGKRIPRAELDRKFFPIGTVEFLKAHPIPGTLYNAHDFGNYLVFMNYKPIFHHGFVTDMDFYEHDVVGIFHGQQQFLETAKKYGWTKLLVDKHGSYPYFYKILSPLTDWKIVAEDEASYLIYYLPDPGKSH